MNSWGEVLRTMRNGQRVPAISISQPWAWAVLHAA